MNNYLLEIGVEELPAKQITQVVGVFKESILQELEKNKLPYEKLNVWSTPRRIVVLIENIEDKLEDELVDIYGPSVAVAYRDNEPTPALIGFLKKNLSDLKDVKVENNGKNDVVVLRKTVEGAYSKDILAKLTAGWVTKAAFDKSMRWRDYDIMFSRPIRWIASVYNHEHLPISIEGLDSDKKTYGHRTLANHSFEIPCALDYLKIMDEAKVIVEPEKRRESICSQINAVVESLNFTAAIDAGLLDEIINIVEYPTVFMGKFDDEFLSLPVPTIVVPMKDHQRYFPVYDRDGKLMPLFLAVRNGNDYCLDIVAKGNEKVLRARLRDVQFFYNDDRKKPLADYVESLKTVVYHAKLGTIYEKVLRIDALSRFIAAVNGRDEAFLANLNKAVMLSKADLNTSMVNEFDELQGTMGAIYARLDGEEEKICTAIESHYLPRYFGDSLPADTIGRIISIADKMDSLVGSFGIGISPKGGRDPFGLRRMMISILSILMSDRTLNVNIADLIAESVKILGNVISEKPEDIISNVIDGFNQRLRVIMGERGLRHDSVEASLPYALSDIQGFIKRCEVLDSYDRVKLSATVTNLLRPLKLSAQAKENTAIDPKLFGTEAERSFFGNISKILPEINEKTDNGDFGGALDKLACLGGYIAEFLDQTMVMDENLPVRENRIQLMKICADTIRRIADFEKLQF
ncbi:MAG: glycine--tRNA ligase subunit beta [Lachnospiraceae bacterium]|nr:glycine--tRNA ligase subunit beta [Lachnospiraceae bacterium]